jgi:hypothetical protein
MRSTWPRQRLIAYVCRITTRHGFSKETKNLDKHSVQAQMNQQGFFITSDRLDGPIITLPIAVAHIPRISISCIRLGPCLGGIVEREPEGQPHISGVKCTNA